MLNLRQKYLLYFNPKHKNVGFTYEQKQHQKICFLQILVYKFLFVVKTNINLFIYCFTTITPFCYNIGLTVCATLAVKEKLKCTPFHGKLLLDETFVIKKWKVNVILTMVKRLKWLSYSVLNRYKQTWQDDRPACTGFTLQVTAKSSPLGHMIFMALSPFLQNL